MMNKKEFVNDVTALIKQLKKQIGNEYRAYEDDTRPGMMITIGADETDWNYQTGDNSYTGGAYNYATWASTAIYRNSKSLKLAENLASELEDSSEKQIFY